ncbi:MAG: hypothetical protein Q9216_002010 [Gyalolechia sp. 2 TL-2023]
MPSVWSERESTGPAAYGTIYQQQAREVREMKLVLEATQKELQSERQKRHALDRELHLTQSEATGYKAEVKALKESISYQRYHEMRTKYLFVELEFKKFREADKAAETSGQQAPHEGSEPGDGSATSTTDEEGAELRQTFNPSEQRPQDCVIEHDHKSMDCEKDEELPDASVVPPASASAQDGEEKRAVGTSKTPASPASQEDTDTFRDTRSNPEGTSQLYYQQLFTYRSRR